VAIPAPGRPETSAFPHLAQHHEPGWGRESPAGSTRDLLLGSGALVSATGPIPEAAAEAERRPLSNFVRNFWRSTWPVRLPRRLRRDGAGMDHPIDIVSLAAVKGDTGGLQYAHQQDSRRDARSSQRKPCRLREPSRE
jgi:hypothetical protein